MFHGAIWGDMHPVTLQATGSQGKFDQDRKVPEFYRYHWEQLIYKDPAFFSLIQHSKW
jgi:hypothetical protein